MNEETLFEEALSRSPEERAGFLEGACEGRPELRAAVEALLAAHEKSGNILDMPPAETVDPGRGVAQPAATLNETPGPVHPSSAATATADYRAKSEAGIVIAGSYTLQEKSGEGGRGEVWVAKQTEPVKRWSRAIAYHRLRKFTEAIKDWDKAIELSQMAEQPHLRAARAASRAQAGQVAEAMAEVAEAAAEVAELAKNPSADAHSWYNFACVYAIASGISADKKQEYSDRAMELLQKAVKAGWSDTAHMAKDTDLDAIRRRDDFEKLIEELAKKSPAEPEQRP